MVSFHVCTSQDLPAASDDLGPGIWMASIKMWHKFLDLQRELAQTNAKFPPITTLLNRATYHKVP